MSLIGSGVLSRVVSDGMISKKRVSQAGPREAFAFRANRYCSKQRDLGYGASLCSCAFVIVTCFKGRHPLPVQERDVRVILLSGCGPRRHLAMFAATLGCPALGVGGTGI